MMKKIVLITSTYPYHPGEQFLETELKYLADYKELKITVMPRSRGDSSKREMSDALELDESFIRSFSFLENIAVFISIFSCSLFYRELFSENFFNMHKIKYLLAAFFRYQKFYKVFDFWLGRQKDLESTIIYLYWHNEASYVFQSLKEKYAYKLVSRIHGGDLYKERRYLDYMPLKKYFTNNIDKIFTITKSANEYLANVYGFNAAVIELSRLGVEDCNIITSPSGKSSFKLLSCSSLVEVKQVHKIVFALAEISNINKEICFSWTHIGDGELNEYIRQLIDLNLSFLSNVRVELMGYMDNTEVFEFYRNNEVDAFINVSSSEGVPVSIMEAMSCGIPIIAPNIGGIPDMLTDGVNGILLSKECLQEEIVNAMNDISFFKEKKVRTHSYQIYTKKYSAAKNYNEFAKSLLNI